MACDDRQLTEAQRVAGYQNQRTGVVQAVRPFSGKPTVDNLIDYINREVYPAIKASRAKVNDVHERVMDNAPSGNPLQFYFSEETAAADPTTGFVRFNQATQDTATVVRVSQTNGRLQDVGPWLDVMAGSATAPLGTITISDVINPARFLRFDLDTMVDQGAYWDLGVTIIESSHDNPFVQDGGLAIAFTPGVAAAGATVPPGAISPIATDTFLGNISGSTAAPSAVPFASIDSASITYDGTAHELRRAALTGFTEAAANSNATTSAEPIITYTASSNMSAERVLSNGTGTTVDIGTAGQVQIDIDTPLTDGDKGDITVSSNGTNWQIDAGAVGDAELRDSAALSVIGRASNSSGDPADIAGTASSDAVLRISGTTLGFGTVATAGIANDAVTNEKLRNSSALSVIGRSASSIGDPADITASGGLQFLQTNSAATVLGFGTLTLAAFPTIADDTFLANISGATAVPSAVALTTLAGAGLTGGADAVLAVGAGTGITVNANDVQLSTVTAETFFGNFTASTAAPAARAGTSVAGAGLTYTAGGTLAVGAGTGITVAADSVAVTIPLTDGDKGDITVSSSGTVWNIDNDVVSNAKLANMTAGTVKGVQVDGATGDPADLTGIEVGELIRYAVLIDTTSTGTVASYAPTGLDSTTTTIRVNPAGTLVIRGMPLAAGQQIAIRLGRTASNTLTINHEDTSASDAAERFNCPGGAALTLRAGEAVVIRNTESRNNIIACGRVSVSDGDYGDITVSSNGTVWNIDAGVVTEVELSASVAGAGLTGGAGTALAVGQGTYITVNANDVAVDRSALAADLDSTSVVNNAGVLERAALTGAITSAQNSNATLFDTNASGAGLTGGGTAVLAVGAGTGITVNANDVAVTIPLTDGDKGDITVSSSGATWTIDNDVVTFAKMQNIGYGVVANPTFATTADPSVLAPSGGFQVLYDNNAGALTFATLVTGCYANDSVTDAKLRNSTALSVIGRSANSSGDPADIAAGTDGHVLRRSGTTLGFGTVALAGLADLAQSTIIGRAEGAGTGVPVALTPTQVAAIIDGEAITWTGAHTFNGTAITANVTTADVLLGAAVGGVGLFSGQATANVTNGDMVFNSASGIALNTNGTAVTSAATGEVAITSTTLDVDVSGSFTIDSTGSSSISAGSGQTLTLSAGSAVVVASPLEAGALVGTGPAEFQDTVAFDGDIALNEAVSLNSTQTSSSTTLNDFALAAGTNMLRLSGSNFLLSGMAPSATSNQVVAIFNIHATDDGSILKESLSSTLGNRFAGDGTSRLVRAGEGVLAVYDNISEAWRIIGGI